MNVYWKTELFIRTYEHFISDEESAMYKHLNTCVNYRIQRNPNFNTVTWLIQSPCYYGQSFNCCSGKAPLYVLIRKPRQYVQRPHSEVPACIILYDFTRWYGHSNQLCSSFHCLYFTHWFKFYFFKLYLHPGCLLKNSCLA